MQMNFPPDFIHIVHWRTTSTIYQSVRNHQQQQTKMRSLLTSPFLLLQAALLASASPAPFPVPAANPAADENCVDISPILCVRYAALCNAPDAEKQIRKDCPRTCGVC